MNIQLIGSGVRESAIERNFRLRGGHLVWFAPGNAGAEHCLPDIKPLEFERLLNAAKSRGVDFAMVGPEAPLCAGIWDYYDPRGVPLCGPSKAAAMTELSKVWFADLLHEYKIPAPQSESIGIDDIDSITDLAIVKRYGAAGIVIKADGLCGGKGVVLPDKGDDLAQICRDLNATHGDNATCFLIQKRERGRECSMIAMADGRSLRFLPTTQDFKRRFDGDKGLNTGGMGAITQDLPEDVDRQCRMIVGDIFRALKARGIEYRGLMYIGFILTEDGPKVLEMNCRGGDPEMQVILESTDIDFAAYCYAMAKGDFGDLPEPTKLYEVVCVNLVDPRYPEGISLPKDTPIRGIKDAENLGAVVLHGATGRGAEDPVTNGATRIVSVLGRAKTREEALHIAYAGANQIWFGNEPAAYRKDIRWAA